MNSISDSNRQGKAGCLPDSRRDAGATRGRVSRTGMEALCGMTPPGRNRQCLWLKVGVRLHVVQRPPRHLFLSPISEKLASIFQKNPSSTRDLNSHFGSDVVNAAGAVAHQVEADNLKDALAVTPGAGVDILAIA